MRKNLQEIICDKFLNVPWYKRMEVLRVMHGWTMKEAVESYKDTYSWIHTNYNL